MRIPKDMTGQRVGMLSVIERAGSDKHGNARWLCRCDCGREALVAGTNLRAGAKKSCGCKRAAGFARKHGLYRAPEYNAIQAARNRCRNARNASYTRYGGRGVEYRLPDDFGEATRIVVEAIGPRPDGMTLDRIDNDGHYELGNLRWATRSEQEANKAPYRRGQRGGVGPRDAGRRGREVSGGWYCSRCGATTKRLPVGAVTCARCGALGLRGYDNARPVRVPCPVGACAEKVWDDGVNPLVAQHQWARHEVLT